MKNSNTFRDRTNRGHSLREWLLAGLTSLCLLHPAMALNPAKAMSQYIHDKWGTERGFLGGAVSSISQSSDGFLWVGTERGLLRFDGFNFTLMQQPIPTLPPIGSVRGLATDADGNMWIRLEQLHLLRYRDGIFKDVVARFQVDESIFTAMALDSNAQLLITGLGNYTLRYHNGSFDSLVNSQEVPGTVISLAETPDGKIWLGTRDEGLFCSKNGHIFNFSKELANAKINALLPAFNGGLWVGTDYGIKFVSIAGAFENDMPMLSRFQILALARDHNGNIWLGTNHGLIRITPQGVESLDLMNLTANTEVTAIFEDRDGDLWYGTSNGIERLRDGMFTTYSTSEGLPFESNGPIYVDSDDRIWFAPLSGGLYWLKGNRMERVTIAGLAGDVVYSISGGNGEIWIGRQRGGLTLLTRNGDSFAARTLTQSNGLAQNSIYSVHRNRDGTVWAGTVSGGVSKLKDGRFTNYLARDGLASNSINSIVEGGDGSMWFATPGGLTSFANGQWKSRTVQDGLPTSNVRLIFEDSRHALWIATSGGLAFLDSGHIGVPQNLPESLREEILGIAEDGLGSLWFATSDHVVLVNRDRLLAGSLRDFDVQSYGISDGLQGVEGVRRDRSMVADALGRIWVSLNRGLAVADPKATLDNLAPMIVRVESMSAGATQVNLTDAVKNPLKIAAGSESVAFNYTSTNLSVPERVRFRYTLDGSDQGWSEAVATRQVTYKNLGPGPYRFRILASNSEGLWNGPEATVPFVIERAFWQTWWFQTSCLLACVLIILLLYRLRMYRLTRQLNIRFQERLGERTRIAQELHDTLLQSFHGLMLRFQTVDEMLPARPLDAKQALEGALDRADQALTESRNAIQDIRSVAPPSLDLAQTMDALMSELAEELSLEGAKTPALDVLVEGTPREVNPIMRDEISRIAREALRNAFHHAKAHRIETEITYSETLLRLRLRDDGKGIDPKVLEHGGREGHWGLVGIKERAKRIGANLEIWSRPGAGTEVELTLPARIAYESVVVRTGFRLFRRKVEYDHDHRS